MNIQLPNIAEQQRVILEAATKESIKTLKANLKAPVIKTEHFDESGYSNKHLLRLSEGWEAPHIDIVTAYFNQFKDHTEYSSDEKLGVYLGLTGKNTGRRIRSFKQGETAVPYGIWRKLLVATGRAPQEIIPVVAFMV